MTPATVSTRSYNSLTPVALFAYRRPRHLKEVVAALQRNPLSAGTDLYVFCDAPRDDAAVPGCREVRRFVRSIKGFRSLHVIERDRNFGLSASVISGVTELCDARGRAIVLEDDIVVSPHFLAYMNDALCSYQEEEKVMSIGGYMFPVEHPLPETFFFRVTDCWGWGVWKRTWKLFQADGGELLAEIERRGLRNEFDLGGAYDYCGMLRAQVRGENDSWAVRWYATALLSGRLTLYPGRSLTMNIGHDGSGTHGRLPPDYATTPSAEPVRVVRIPVEEDALAVSTISEFLRSMDRQPLHVRVRQKLRTLFNY